MNREVFDKPEEFYTLDKLRKAAAVDRRLTLREILEKVFGLIPYFKSKDELLVKACVASDQVRQIIEGKEFTLHATHPMFSTRDFKAVPAKYRPLVPEYVKDYVSVNEFAV